MEETSPQSTPDTQTPLPAIPLVSPFSRPAESIIRVFEKKETPNHESKVTVNRFVSEIANWYEKLRNAMDYRDEEVVLRASIERILKRRIGMRMKGVQKTSGAAIAEPLLKELVWAHYFPNGTIRESYSAKVAEIIDVWIRWRKG